MSATSNVPSSDENALTTKEAHAGQLREQMGWPPGLAVRLPGVIEHLVERHDRDVVRWLGNGFDRPATAAERAFLAARGALRDPSASPRLQTRIDVRGGLRRRTWPTLDAAL